MLSVKLVVKIYSLAMSNVDFYSIHKFAINCINLCAIYSSREILRLQTIEDN